MCHSLEPTRIAEGLARVASNEQLYTDAVRAGQNALKDELGEEIFLTRLAELLGIDADVLAET